MDDASSPPRTPDRMVGRVAITPSPAQDLSPAKISTRKKRGRGLFSSTRKKARFRTERKKTNIDNITDNNTVIMQVVEKGTGAVMAKSRQVWMKDEVRDKVCDT